MSFLNETGLAHLWGKITTELNNKLNTKVDKVSGKGLSTNDYTKAEKDKLTNIAAGATRVLVKKFGITLSADKWSKDAPYYQNVFYQGISVDDTPFIMPKLDSNTDLAMVQLDGWSCISQATTGTNIIHFKCFEKKPEIDIPLIVQVIS